MTLVPKKGICLPSKENICFTMCMLFPIAIDSHWDMGKNAYFNPLYTGELLRCYMLDEYINFVIFGG